MHPDAKPPAYVSAQGPVGFDDLDGGDGQDGVQIPDGYHTINWTNIFSANGALTSQAIGATNGYGIGTISPQNMAFSPGSGAAAELRADSGTFSLKSVYLTSAFESSEQVEVTAFRAGVKTFDQTLTITDTQATLEKLNLKNVDDVLFTPVNLTSNGGNQVVFDDFSFVGGTINGTVYNDLNGDGRQSGSEKGLANVAVYIDTNHNGRLDSGEYSVTTDANGKYQFANVTPGTYDIRQATPAGYYQTSPAPQLGVTYSAKAATLAFVDITGSGTAITPANADEGFATLNLSNPVNFYGIQYGTAYVSTNGFISFTPPSGSTYHNTALPAKSAPSPLIAALWTDLYNNDGTGNIYYQNDSANHRFIVEWSSFQDYGTTKHETFEAIVSYDGHVSFEYGQLDGGGTNVTVGVQNRDGSAATQIAYDQSIASNSAFALTPISHLVAGAVGVTVYSGKTATADGFGDQQIPSGAAHIAASDLYAAHHWAT